MMYRAPLSVLHAALQATVQCDFRSPFACRYHQVEPLDGDAVWTRDVDDRHNLHYKPLADSLQDLGNVITSPNQQYLIDNDHFQ